MINSTCLPNSAQKHICVSHRNEARISCLRDEQPGFKNVRSTTDFCSKLFSVIQKGCHANMLRLFVFSLFMLFLYACPNRSHTQEASPYRDPIVIQIIHLDYADADHLASVLAPLLSKQGRVVAYSPTNTLIIKDRASIVKKLVKIIKGKPARNR